jgi:hypothetical protein
MTTDVLAVAAGGAPAQVMEYVTVPTLVSVTVIDGILTADSFIEHTRSDIPPGIVLWDIYLGGNISHIL